VSTDLDALLRWEARGAAWRVTSRTEDRLVVALLTCDGGEQVGTLATPEADVRAHVGDRDTSHA
jgi:hypothetical protein